MILPPSDQNAPAAGMVGSRMNGGPQQVPPPTMEDNPFGPSDMGNVPF
jgi:hypothetical protein